MIRFRDVLCSHCLHLVATVICGMMIGCDGGSSSSGTPTTADPKVGSRTEDMKAFMDKEKQAGKGARR